MAKGLLILVIVALTLATVAGQHEDRAPPAETQFIGCPEADEASVQRLSPEDFRNRTTKTPLPDFPPHCRCQGLVVIRVLVDNHGKVACLTAVSGHPLLTSPAINALKRWRFRPLRRDGREVSFLGLAFIRLDSLGGVSISHAEDKKPN